MRRGSVRNLQEAGEKFSKPWRFGLQKKRKAVAAKKKAARGRGKLRGKGDANLTLGIFKAYWRLPTLRAAILQGSQRSAAAVVQDVSRLSSLRCYKFFKAIAAFAVKKSAELAFAVDALALLFSVTGSLPCRFRRIR